MIPTSFLVRKESLAAVMSGTETEFDKEQVKWLNELLSKQESIKNYHQMHGNWLNMELSI